jgi:lysophospholipase L1-like esterase
MARVAVACLGDSITAGSPLWDPDPARRAADSDERSQWGWWAERRAPELELRNHGVYGQRTDEIAARLDLAARGASLLVVQGGINDVAQRRPVEEAARNLAGMLEHGRRLGLAVVLADVLPWPNGDARAAADIARLNVLVHALADGLDVPLLPFHDTLAARADWSDDGDHPSIDGHRLLGEAAAPLLSAASRPSP